MYSIGWFSTGRDEAARQLLETVHGNIKKGEIEAEISFVFSNREPGEAVESDLFFELVKGYGIPLIQFSSTRFKSERQAITSWRSEYDREVMRQLRDFRHHLCVLAGYMLIVGDEMCQKYNMINLHPAFPGGPTGTWQEVIWKLIESKAESSGVMIHLVTPQLDRGPAVAYCTFSTRGGPFDRYWAQIEGLSPEEVKQRGESLQLFKAIRHYELIREFPLIIATIKAFSEGKIRISQEKQVVNAEGRPINGYNLTGKINELVKQAEYRSSKG